MKKLLTGVDALYYTPIPIRMRAGPRMKEPYSYSGIALTKDKWALISPEDSNALREFTWYAVQNQSSGKWYAYTDVHTSTHKVRRMYIHRMLLNAPRGFDVDHINGDTLDNRRINLRVASRAQNLANRGLPRNNATGFKGVHQIFSGRYIARLGDIHLGTFRNKTDAAKAYDAAARAIYGEFAHTNFHPRPPRPPIVRLVKRGNRGKQAAGRRE